MVILHWYAESGVHVSTLWVNLTAADMIEQFCTKLNLMRP